MGENLLNRLKMTKQPPLREEVALNLAIAASYFSGKIEKILDEFGISGAQYNVLRILKGVYPEGHARCAIAMRMIERSPDITRIIDRLEKQGLVERIRTEEDRRMSITKITGKGIEIVNKVNPLVSIEHAESTANLSDEECKLLSELTEKLYKDMG